jgi:hypothetical protein
MSEFDNINNEGIYQIKIIGNIDRYWSSGFHGLKVSTSDGDQFTTLTGRIKDQAKLRGILNKIWDLNLIVISLNRLEE